MPTEINFARGTLLRQPRTKKPRPNRIFELTKARKWTYPEVARRVRELAIARGDDSRSKCHTITINRLATGDANLTQEWMNIFGEVFGVPAAEIISAPLNDNLRRVPLLYALEAGNWRRESQLPEPERYDITIPHEPALADATLYAGEVRGHDNDQRYPQGAIVIMSKLDDPGAAGDAVPGKRYHVRVTRADGLVEDSIKLLTLGPDGQLWLRPESNHPQHQEWTPITGRSGDVVKIVGRVRGVFLRED